MSIELEDKVTRHAETTKVQQVRIDSLAVRVIRLKARLDAMIEMEQIK